MPRTSILPKVQLICLHCSASFLVRSSEEHRHKFCSGPCRQLHAQKVSLYCKLCGQEFFVQHCRAGTAKYCSMDCSQRGLIWNKIDISGGTDACWEFQGARHERGYGKKTRNGLNTFVHRFVYAETYGPIPEGMQINHRCNNPPCCNPRHLYAGTQSENTNDAIRSGRYRTVFLPGQNHWGAKLTDDDVSAILLLKGKATGRKVAQDFSIGEATISNIWGRRAWKHITQDSESPPS